jgi:hypothetical protein
MNWYVVQYEIPPFRAINIMEVYASDEESAKRQAEKKVPHSIKIKKVSRKTIIF